MIALKPFSSLVQQFDCAAKQKLILYYTVERSSQGSQAVTIHFTDTITPDIQNLLITHINTNYGTCAIRDIEPAQRSWIRFILAKPA